MLQLCGVHGFIEHGTTLRKIWYNLLLRVSHRFDSGRGCQNKNRIARWISDCRQSLERGFVKVFTTSEKFIYFFLKKLLTYYKIQCIIAYVVWRYSSVGQSMRFIPAVSLVRIQLPLPKKSTSFEVLFFIEINSIIFVTVINTVLVQLL